MAISVYRMLATCESNGVTSGIVEIWRTDLPDDSTIAEQDALMIPAGVENATAAATTRSPEEVMLLTRSQIRNIQEELPMDAPRADDPV